MLGAVTILADSDVATLFAAVALHSKPNPPKDPVEGGFKAPNTEPAPLAAGVDSDFLPASVPPLEGPTKHPDLHQ